MTIKEKADELGATLRFITPILIAIVGWVTINYLSSIDRHFDKIDEKIDDFLAQYQKMDTRVTKLEYKVFKE